MKVSIRLLSFFGAMAALACPRTVDAQATCPNDANTVHLRYLNGTVFDQSASSTMWLAHHAPTGEQRALLLDRATNTCTPLRFTTSSGARVYSFTTTTNICFGAGDDDIIAAEFDAVNTNLNIEIFRHPLAMRNASHDKCINMSNSQLSEYQTFVVNVVTLRYYMGEGNDRVWGTHRGSGVDLLIGEQGDDLLVDASYTNLATGKSQMIGGPGNDILVSGIGNGDYLLGNEGTDYVIDRGGSGDNLYGGTGMDCVENAGGGYTSCAEIFGPDDGFIDFTTSPGSFSCEWPTSSCYAAIARSRFDIFGGPFVP